MMGKLSLAIFKNMKGSSMQISPPACSSASPLPLKELQGGPWQVRNAADIFIWLPYRMPVEIKGT